MNLHSSLVILSIKELLVTQTVSYYMSLMNNLSLFSLFIIGLYFLNKNVTWHKSKKLQHFTICLAHHQCCKCHSRNESVLNSEELEICNN